jgi:1-acyl-sn-glycerol-3-phosphate acyltransferase
MKILCLTYPLIFLLAFPPLVIFPEGTTTNGQYLSTIFRRQIPLEHILTGSRAIYSYSGL